jgi:RND family efflux transporter MFP subunit
MPVMNKTLYRLIGRLFLVAILFCSCNNGQKQERKANAVSVKTFKVEAGAYTVAKNFMGSIDEEDGANVTFGVLGSVVKVMAEEGQFVRKGQPLAEVDGQNVRNAHDISAATLNQAEDAYRRLKDLYEKGTLPEIKMVEMEATLARARAAEAISSKSVSEIVLTAPFDGFVASSNVHVGANVTPGLSGFHLVKIDRVKVDMSVPECEIGKIKIGQQVSFTVSALGDSIFTGKIVTRGVAANAINHTYTVCALVDNPKHILLPGMVCKVKMESVSDSYSIVIPQQTIQISGNEKFVWVVRDGKAHRQSVLTGDIINDGVIIESGLTNGDVVILEGQSKVCEDTEVITVQ